MPSLLKFMKTYILLQKLLVVDTQMDRQHVDLTFLFKERLKMGCCSGNGNGYRVSVLWGISGHMMPKMLHKCVFEYLPLQTFFIWR
jgi:hypothetical protein